MPAQGSVKSVRALVAQFSNADPVVASTSTSSAQHTSKPAPSKPAPSKPAPSLLNGPKTEQRRSPKPKFTAPATPSPFFSKKAENLRRASSKRHAAYPPPLSPTERRSRRYKAAEEALHASAQHATREPTTLDQKLRALRQATALLNYYARESQADVTRLRTLLAQRNVDEDEFEAARVNRWLQERRTEHLMEEKCRIQAQMENAAEWEAVAQEEDRRQRNLQHFITQDPTTKRIYAPMPTSRRILTRRNVSPMRLRTTVKSRPPFVTSSGTATASRKQRLYPPRRPSQVPASTTFKFDDDNLSISSGYNGRVTIFRTATPPKATVDMSHVELVRIPSYARNLMDHFDEESGEISLPLRRFSLGQRPPPPPLPKKKKARPIPPSMPPTLPELDLLPSSSKPRPLSRTQPPSSFIPMPPQTTKAPPSPSKASSRSKRWSKLSARAEHRFDSDRSVFDFFSSKSAPHPTAKLTKRPKRRSFFSHDSSTDRPSALALFISRPKALKRPAQRPMGPPSERSSASDSRPALPKTSLQIAPPTLEDDRLYREAASYVPSGSSPTTPTRSRGRQLARKLSVVDISIFRGGGGSDNTSPKKAPRRAKSFTTRRDTQIPEE